VKGGMICTMMKVLKGESYRLPWQRLRATATSFVDIKHLSVLNRSHELKSHLAGRVTTLVYPCRLSGLDTLSPLFLRINYSVTVKV
jgi:hypothetical protein